MMTVQHRRERVITLILDGESGDEMVENEVETPEKANRKKKKRVRRPRMVKGKISEVAVGRDIEEDDIHEVEDKDDEEDEVGMHYESSTAGVINEMEHDIEIDEGNTDDEDDEVDEEDSELWLSKRGALKHEAKTKEHLLTHRFKKPYCESCVRAGKDEASKDIHRIS